MFQLQREESLDTSLPLTSMHVGINPLQWAAAAAAAAAPDLLVPTSFPRVDEGTGLRSACGPTALSIRAIKCNKKEKEHFNRNLLLLPLTSLRY